MWKTTQVPEPTTQHGEPRCSATHPGSVAIRGSPGVGVLGEAEDTLEDHASKVDL